MSNGTKAKYLTLFIIFNFVTYFGIQLLFTVSEYNFLITLDNSIPFIPEFIWVYHTLIPVILITMFSFVSKKEVFLSAFTAFMIASVTLSIFYVLFPSFYPRESFVDPSSISGWLVEWIPGLGPDGKLQIQFACPNQLKNTSHVSLPEYMYVRPEYM